MSHMEGVPFSKCGSRLRAAHTRLTHLQELHGLRANGFQSVALAFAPRTFVQYMCECFTDCGRFLFKMWLSPQRRVHA
eukprot:1832131-Pyramimonas_sp.AAC.1